MLMGTQLSAQGRGRPHSLHCGRVNCRQNENHSADVDTPTRNMCCEAAAGDVGQKSLDAPACIGAVLLNTSDGSR